MAGDSHGRVSVIIPARNEETNIARVVRSVAAQQDVREILVVDDQSTDRTGQILESLKGEIPALRVIRLDSLPPGWFGKTHAAAAGARTAGAEWLLFTDADTEHLPYGLHELLGRAEREEVELLSLSPGQMTLTWWEKAVTPMVYAWLARRFRFEQVNDPASPAAAANGQYLLIRRQAYDRVGGHQMVRDMMLEDVALAGLVKSSGGRLLFLPGAAWVRTRMYRTFREMWQGWTKNLYLLAGASVPPLLRTIAQFCFFDLVPLLASVIFGFAAVFNVVNWKQAVPLALPGIVLYLWRGMRYRRAVMKLGFEPAADNYRLPGAVLFSALLISSGWTYRCGGKVKWKDRTYPIRG
jgi:cellulose synthase/poly-beta-1,6-N-acetylglucosamine synthase-like glycosyltransferase